MITKPNPKRLKTNRNHTLHYEKIFTTSDGTRLPVMTDKGPLLSEYLERGYGVMDIAMKEDKRVLVLRFDLHLPFGASLPDDARSNKVMRRFLSSFQSKIDMDLKRKNCKHKCKVRHIVAREIGATSQRPHFHVMLFLNGNAYRSMGMMDYEGNNNFWRIVEAWASALGVSLEAAFYGVQCTWRERGVTKYFLGPIDHYAELPAVFKRMSYFCKSHTKVYGKRLQGLMTSEK